MTTRFLKNDQTTSQNLALAALDNTFTFTGRPKIVRIMFHFSQAVTETITVTIDSTNGANYDTVLREVELVSETDYILTPEFDLDLQPGDGIRVQCTDSGGAGIVYVTLKSVEI